MKSIERRLGHLEEKVPLPDCGHKLAFLREPTEEEVETVRKEIDECPQCSKGGKPLIVILKRFGKVEEEPAPAVQGFEFEVEEEPAKNGTTKLISRPTESNYA